VKLGLSPIEAIRAATLTGAELMGWQSSVGSIEKGKFGNDDAVRYARSNDLAKLCEAGIRDQNRTVWSAHTKPLS